MFIEEVPEQSGRCMVAEIRSSNDSEWAAISEVARLLGVGCAETVRVRQAVDAGARPGTTPAELKRACGGPTLNCEGRTRF